jgi:hypothetical protein
VIVIDEADDGVHVGTIPAMMNAFLDFVGAVNQQLEKKDEHRFFSVFLTTYAGKDIDADGPSKYDAFNICCVLLPGASGTSTRQ